MKPGWVYILRCSDGSYYTGSSSSIEHRIAQHRAGAIGSYTATRLPLTVVYVQQFADISDAIRAERQLKGWSRRKKEALMHGDFDLLPLLSRSRRRDTK